MDKPKGHEYTLITCRACGRSVRRIGIGNELVGCQARMRCAVCGSRGADLLRVYSQNPPQLASVSDLGQRTLSQSDHD